MPSINMTDIQNAASKKFGDFEVHISDKEVLLFKPALRLPKEKRRELHAALDIKARAALDNGDDLFDVYKDSFRISAVDAKTYARLEEVVGDDPAVWQELFVAFNEDTMAGEAAPSES